MRFRGWSVVFGSCSCVQRDCEFDCLDAFCGKSKFSCVRFFIRLNCSSMTGGGYPRVLSDVCRRRNSFWSWSSSVMSRLYLKACVYMIDLFVVSGWYDR